MARLRFARWALAFCAALVGCRGRGEPPSWVSLEGGGELGRRVRAGQVQGIAHHVFRSSTLGRDVGLAVAVPPGYGEGSQRHPVVYMFPGIGGDEWSYLQELNAAGPTLKALFADPAHAPIVVLANPGSSGAYGPAERVLNDELVAFVDKTYRTIATAKGRSLEGFSLGGATALTLLLRHPDRFGRAVAGSSACYLLSECDAIRAQLRAAADKSLQSRVLLSVGEREDPKNASINEELAGLLGLTVKRIAGADHNWGAQLNTQEFGEQVAAFHLAGFR